MYTEEERRLAVEFGIINHYLTDKEKELIKNKLKGITKYEQIKKLYLDTLKQRRSL